MSQENRNQEGMSRKNKRNRKAGQRQTKQALSFKRLAPIFFAAAVFSLFPKPGLTAVAEHDASRPFNEEAEDLKKENGDRAGAVAASATITAVSGLAASYFLTVSDRPTVGAVAFSVAAVMGGAFTCFEAWAGRRASDQANNRPSDS